MLGTDRQMQIDKTNAQPCSEPAQDGTSSPEEPAWAQRNEPMERGQLLHQITSFSHRQHQVGDRQQAQRNEPGRYCSSDPLSPFQSSTPLQLRSRPQWRRRHFTAWSLHPCHISTCESGRGAWFEKFSTTSLWKTVYREGRESSLISLQN